MAHPAGPSPLAKLHRIAGILAVACITSFQVATLVAEGFLDRSAVIAVKTALPFGLFLLVPALATVGISGVRLARGRKGGVLGQKLRRMPIIAANGLLVLIPAALYLAAKARAGDLDTAFYAVQGIELAAGAVNLWLMGLSIRDGLKMTAARRRAARA